MDIKRDRYLNKLIEKQGNGMIKIITGIRRCGKSYLLFNLFHDHLLSIGTSPDHIIEVALDDRRNKKLRDPDEMLSYLTGKIQDEGRYFVLLDEVQLMSEFEDVLNSLLHIRNADVYVTGSNSKFLSSDVVTEFRGRGDEIRMYPLSFSEFMSAYPGSVARGWFEYYNYGGLPLVASAPTAEAKEEYLRAQFNNVYLSDLFERHNIKNREELDELIDILASSVGSLTNTKKLSNTFASVKNKIISDKTIKKYIEYMQDAFLISRAMRYDIKGKKYINSLLKYYFEDVGLRNARLNFRQTEENHLMENVIYNELRYRGYNVDFGLVDIYGKDKQGKTVKKRLEVDFIATKGSKKYYVQSAFSMPTAEKKEQEERPLLNIGDSFKKIIVVKDDVGVTRDEYGVVTIGITDFLLDQNSLDF